MDIHNKLTQSDQHGKAERYTEIPENSMDRLPLRMRHAITMALLASIVAPACAVERENDEIVDISNAPTEPSKVRPECLTEAQILIKADDGFDILGPDGTILDGVDSWGKINGVCMDRSGPCADIQTHGPAEIIATDVNGRVVQLFYEVMDDPRTSADEYVPPVRTYGLSVDGRREIIISIP